jgi:hypothetical protein
MKKLLIPLIFSLIAAWSCDVGTTYSATNVQDIVTIVEHQLVNDSGVLYTVTSAPKDMPELQEGHRYYLFFDILNQNFEIDIKSVSPIDIIIPQEDTGEIVEAHDPVTIQFNYIGPKYIDLAFNYYYDPTSNCAHDVFVRSEYENRMLKLTLYHDGNDENPTTMSEDLLKQKTRIISISLGEKEVTSVSLTLNLLGTDEKGNPAIITKTYTTAN